MTSNPISVTSSTAGEVLGAEATIGHFLQCAAAKRPAPGGGSVAALAGALSVSMGEMVLNYSIGRKDSAAHDPLFREVLAELSRARQLLIELMIEDQLAFAALSAARKTAGDRGDVDPAFGAALLACIRIPQSIGTTAAAVLELAERVTPFANRYLLSDLAVCAELAVATVRCAGYNVRVNLADVSDADERARFREWTEHLLARSIDRVGKVIPAIWARVES